MYEIAETQVRISSDSLKAEQEGNRDSNDVPHQTNQSGANFNQCTPGSPSQ